MKKLLFSTIATVFVLNAFAQQQNEEEKLFAKHLKELGYQQQDMDEQLYNLLAELENDSLYEKYKEDKDYIRMKMNKKGIYNYNFELTDFEFYTLNNKTVKEIADMNMKKFNENGKIFKQAIKIQKTEGKFKGKMISLLNDEIVIEDSKIQVNLTVGGTTRTWIVIEGKTLLESLYFQALFEDSALTKLPELEQYKKIKEKIYTTTPKEKIEIKDSRFRKGIPIKFPFNGLIITDAAGKILVSDIWTQ